MNILRMLLFAVLVAPTAFAQTWAVQPTPTGNDLNDVFARSAQEAYAVGEFGVVLRTTDGGQTWAQQILTNQDLEGVEFNTGGVGIAASDAGNVFRTTDGVAWAFVGTGSNGSLRDVAFGTDAVVWAVSREGDALRSTNAGVSWSTANTGAGQDLRGMDAVGTDAAWVVGDGGTIRVTANAGATWSSQPAGTGADLRAIQMLDAQTGYIVGNNNTVLKTTNGGATWTSVSNGNTGGDGLFFLDANTGWLADNLGVVWFTDNGGASWVIQNSGTNADLSAVHFANASSGWAAGDGGVVTAFTGVDPITLTATAQSVGPGTFAALSWSPADGGRMQVFVNGAAVAVARDNGAFSVRLGRNASGTFTFQVCETDSGDCSNVASLTVGQTASDTASSASLGAEAPTKTEVLGAFPNPLQTTSRIAFALSETSLVELSVYNALGQRVAVLTDETLEEGRHEATFDGSALPSGVYVYRLLAGPTVQTGQLTLTK